MCPLEKFLAWPRQQLAFLFFSSRGDELLFQWVLFHPAGILDYDNTLECLVDAHPKMPFAVIVYSNMCGLDTPEDNHWWLKVSCTWEIMSALVWKDYAGVVKDSFVLSASAHSKLLTLRLGKFWQQR